ncbi:hypothetical protein GALL_536610 [mine drainage metagenome]|uniref:Uncharacterized protein n=1 Tax=mine drainage metagenome TaxID=410659 RepID=A0A1J5PMI7_9ZZZZ
MRQVAVRVEPRPQRVIQREARKVEAKGNVAGGEGLAGLVKPQGDVCHGRVDAAYREGRGDGLR